MTVIHCPKCGKEISDETVEPSPASQPPSGREAFLDSMAQACRPQTCPHCGAPLARERPRGSAFVVNERAAAIDPQKSVIFRHPKTHQVIDITQSPSWVLLLGFFYFAAKGIWTHAVISALLAIGTAGISWLVYPFFAKKIVRNHLLITGWEAVGK